jgi:hypothetical protein
MVTSSYHDRIIDLCVFEHGGSNKGHHQAPDRKHPQNELTILSYSFPK